MGQWLVGCSLAGALGCGATSPSAEAPSPTPAQPKASAPAAAPPPSAEAPSIARLRTGSIEPVEVATPIDGRVEARSLRDGWELLVVELPSDWASAVPTSSKTPGLWGDDGRPNVVHVTVPGAEAALSFALLGDSDPTARQLQSSAGPPPPRDLLWLRRPQAEAGRELTVTLFTASMETQPGYRLNVHVPTYDQLQDEGDLHQRYQRALARYVRGLAPSPFRSFALLHLPLAQTGVPHPQPEPESNVGWDDLMALTTGERSVEQALQTKSPLRAHTAERPSIPLAKLQAPQLNIPPYAQMLAELGTTVPSEPLAEATPAEFYFARSRRLDALFELLDEVDSWVTPAVHVMDARLQRHELAARYQTQLGLRRTGLSRHLGPELLEELAVVGSDPFLRDGSDVTVLLRPRNDTALGVALQTLLRVTAEEHGGVETKQLRLAGQNVSFSRSPDRAVTRYSTVAGGVHVVSNSPAALTRVLETMQGRHAALAREPDFRYMLARDATVPADVFAFAGDRFLANAVSPRSRILDARRQVAKSELLRVSYGALLYGWLYGKVAASGEDLMKSVVFSEAELRHFDGERITFSYDATHTGPRSAWGAPATLTPLIDLPTPARVTATEQGAYESFVRRYQSLWAEALDPMALRVRVQRDGDTTSLGARLRVVPLVRDAELLSMTEVVGDGRVRPGQLASGVRALLALPKDSGLRRELSGQSHSVLGRRLAVDWIGPYAMLGVLDHPSLANALLHSEWVPQMPVADAPQPRSETEWLFDAPLYGAVAVDSRKGAALTLAVLKERLSNIGRFVDRARYRGQAVTEVVIEGEQLSVFYALTDHLLIVSLSEATLHALIDRALTPGGLPSAGAPNDGASGQWVFDLAGKAGGGLWTAATWALERELDWANAESREQARLLFYGVPATASDATQYDAVALGYLGAVPVTKDGQRFTLRASGVADPARGNAHAPSWPELPVAGSDAQAVLERLESLRSSVSFELEPAGGAARPVRSLSVTLEARLTGARNR